MVPAAEDEFRIEWSSQSLGVDTAGPMFSGELAAYLRHRSSLAPELVLEPISEIGGASFPAGLSLARPMLPWSSSSVGGGARKSVLKA